MDDELRAYADGVDPAHRPLFDRVTGLVARERPQARVGIAYGMPAYRLGKGRLYVAAWKHGVSLYGWGAGRDGGFTERHPDLVHGRGTIRLTPQAARGVDDAELVALVHGALPLP